MTISVERVGHSLAARVAGLDLTQPLDPGQVSQIEAGMDEHAVLIDPAQIIRDLVEHATQPCSVYVHR